jgi:hypothetical protein
LELSVTITVSSLSAAASLIGVTIILAEEELAGMSTLPDKAI